MDKYSKNVLISMDFLLSHNLGDKFLIRMLGIYEVDIQLKLDIIKSALTKLDQNAFRIALHTLASHIRDLGVSKLHSQLLSLEKKKLSVDELDNIKEEIETVSSQCQSIIQQITERKKTLEIS